MTRAEIIAFATAIRHAVQEGESLNFSDKNQALYILACLVVDQHVELARSTPPPPPPVVDDRAVELATRIVACWPGPPWIPSVDQDTGEWNGTWGVPRDGGEPSELDGSTDSDYAKDFAEIVTYLPILARAVLRSTFTITDEDAEHIRKVRNYFRDCGLAQWTPEAMAALDRILSHADSSST